MRIYSYHTFYYVKSLSYLLKKKTYWKKKMEAPYERKGPRGFFKPDGKGGVVDYYGDRINMVKKIFSVFFIRPLLIDPDTQKLSNGSIISQWEAELEYDEGFSFKLDNFGLATILGLLSNMTDYSMWEKKEKSTYKLIKKYSETNRMISSTYERDLILIRTFKDFFKKTYGDILKMVDKYDMEYNVIAKKYKMSNELKESKDMLLDIFENLFSKIPNPYTLRGLLRPGGEFSKVLRVSPNWRYRDIKEMFEPGDSVLGINVMSMHKFISKHFSIYELLKPLRMAEIEKVNRPPEYEEFYEEGDIIKTYKGNSFKLLKIIGKGGNGIVYSALTYEKIPTMSFITYKVILKLGRKKNFSEQMVYECVEYSKDTLNIDESQPALISYYDYAYINGVHMMVLEDIKGKPTKYSYLNEFERELIDDAIQFVQWSSGVMLQDFAGPGNIMYGPRTDKRFEDYGIYLIDLDPFGQL